MYKIVQQISDIKVGSRVKVRCWTNLATVRMNLRDAIVCQIEYDGATHSRTLGKKDYEYTLGISKDCEIKIGEFLTRNRNEIGELRVDFRAVTKILHMLWTECEQYYGINVNGSTDPEVFRQIALAALKGDGMALDIINDGLGGGRFEIKKEGD